jgi:hypothetical protein
MRGRSNNDEVRIQPQTHTWLWVGSMRNFLCVVFFARNHSHFSCLTQNTPHSIGLALGGATHIQWIHTASAVVRMRASSWYKHFSVFLFLRGVFIWVQIQCDLCQQWYHGACVGITARQGRTIAEYACLYCRKTDDGTTVTGKRDRESSVRSQVPRILLKIVDMGLTTHSERRKPPPARNPRLENHV